MRMHNDTRLAESVDGIDIILGGHDHFYAIKMVRLLLRRIANIRTYLNNIC